MSFTHFNPPFTNATVDDFFDVETQYSEFFLELREYILERFPDVRLGLSYHVPYFTFGGKKLFYFHYFKDDLGELRGEVSFAHGKDIEDVYTLFSKKNKITKSISLSKISSDMSLLLSYIEQSLHIAQKT